jgi:hypothetical protein
MNAICPRCHFQLHEELKKIPTLKYEQKCTMEELDQENENLVNKNYNISQK